MSEGEATTEHGVWHRVRDGFRRLHAHLHKNRITGLITKVVVTGIGLLVIGAGLVMMVTPGPGIVAVLVGLGILATEWDWAERWVHAMRVRAQQAAEAAREMDPAVRRRRLLLTGLALVVLAGAIVWYLSAFGWPDFAVSSWDWVQSIFDAVPELPGM